MKHSQKKMNGNSLNSSVFIDPNYFLEYGITDDSLTVEQFIKQQWELELKKLEDQLTKELELFQEKTAQERKKLELYLKKKASV